MDYGTCGLFLPCLVGTILSFTEQKLSKCIALEVYSIEFVYPRIINRLEFCPEDDGYEGWLWMVMHV
jgi:hypothetical protein